MMLKQRGHALHGRVLVVMTDAQERKENKDKLTRSGACSYRTCPEDQAECLLFQYRNLPINTETYHIVLTDIQSIHQS